MGTRECIVVISLKFCCHSGQGVVVLSHAAKHCVFFNRLAGIVEHQHKNVVLVDTVNLISPAADMNNQVAEVTFDYGSVVFHSLFVLARGCGWMYFHRR